MQSVKLYTGSALKTLTNAQVMDPWSDWSEAIEGDFSVTDANKAVAWFYRCVVLRASAVSAMPFNIEANGKPVDNWPYQDALIRLLYLTEAALCLRGQAYWLRQRNRVKDLGCRWLAPSTMQYKADSVNGLTGFERTVGNTKIKLSTDEVVYFWMPDSELEVGPGTGPGEVALKAAGIASSINEFSDSFFKRGAIPAVLLTVEGNPSQAELDKLQAWWKKLLSGAKKAWETVAVKAQVKPQIIQQPMKDLAMTELKAGTRSEIAVAFGVPETMLEESAANYACLPGDQHVYTPNGSVCIDALKTGDSIWQYTPTGIIQNTVEIIIPQGEAPVYEITTPRRKLRASDNHPILTIKVIPGRGPYEPQSQVFVWKRTDEIQLGDLLVSVEELPDQRVTEVDGFALTESFMELCGLYIGDGSGRGAAELNFAIPSGPLQDYYAEQAERYFKYTKGIGPNGKGIRRDYDTRKLKCRRYRYSFSVGSKDAYRFFDRLGLTGNARTKRVPDWVFSLSIPLRLAFLRGYLDSDGTVSKRGSLVFGGANNELIFDVRCLCISCGIPVSNVLHDVGREGNYGPIEIHRFTCGYPKYNRLIGSHDAWYQERLETESNGTRDGRYMPGRTQQVYNITLPPGIGIERVSRIEYIGDQEVYDLVTTGTHTFIAEGIVVHNTAAAHRKSFYTETILPECDLIQAVINEQWLAPQGLRLTFQPEELEVMQEEEASRAASLKALVDAGMPLEAAMLILGYDVSPEVQAILDRENTDKEERREQMAQQLQAQPTPPALPPAQEEQAAPVKSNGHGALMDDLERWRRKALKALKAGKPASVDFESEHIPADMALMIQAALVNATDPGEVKAAFAKATDGDTAALMDAAIQHQVAALVLAGLSEVQYEGGRSYSQYPFKFNRCHSQADGRFCSGHSGAGVGSGGGNEGDSSPGKQTARSQKERAAINSSEYLTVLDEGQFEGYHWTTPPAALSIRGQGLRGVPWDENLGFTNKFAKLSKKGAVFAFESLDKDYGLQEWGDNAICFRIKGHGYLVNHSMEGNQLIFRADQSTAEQVVKFRNGKEWH